VALTLRVTSFQSQALGAQSAKTFGAEGGSIGRRPDNDWVLPDPERFISGCHAKIACRNGTFYLLDTSSNGTFINGSTRPIGNGTEQPLHDGDQLRIGEYEISVRLDAAASTAFDAPGFDEAGSMESDPFGPSEPTGPFGIGDEPFGAPSSADPLDSFPGAPQAAPSPHEAGPQADHASSMEEFFQPPPVERAPPPPPTPEPRPQGNSGAIPENWDETGFSAPEPKPAPPPPRAPDPFGASQPPPAQQHPAPAAPAPHDAGQPYGRPGPSETPSAAPAAGAGATAMVALLQAAGLDPASARAAAASPELAGTLGRLLNVVVQGMFEVLKARAEVKSQFRVPVTMMRPVENNPLKFSATPAQALQVLLDTHNQAYQGPVEAFAEGFDDVKAHQVAMMAGMRAAFNSMIQRFDPEELAERFEKHLKRGALLNMPGKGRYWEMYRDLYEEWMRDSDSNFQRLFGEEFAKAYEEQMRRLTVAKRR
jgi:type VI secretion system protein